MTNEEKHKICETIDAYMSEFTDGFFMVGFIAGTEGEGIMVARANPKGGSRKIMRLANECLRNMADGKP